MWGRWPWGGYGMNPLPSRFEALWDETAGLVTGGAPYAEGIYIDANLVIALRHYWAAEPANATVLAYAAFEFGGAQNAELVARTVALLEENWDGARPGPRASPQPSLSRWTRRWQSTPPSPPRGAGACCCSARVSTCSSLRTAAKLTAATRR